MANPHTEIQVSPCAECKTLIHYSATGYWEYPAGWSELGHDGKWTVHIHQVGAWPPRKPKRPPTAGVSKTVWLRKQTQAAVQAAADANGISVSAQLKRIVDQWCQCEPLRSMPL